jgi:hypothetical protein
MPSYPSVRVTLSPTTKTSVSRRPSALFPFFPSSSLSLPNFFAMPRICKACRGGPFLLGQLFRDPTGSYVCYSCIDKCEREECRTERDARIMLTCASCGKKCCPSCICWKHHGWECIECALGSTCLIPECAEWAPDSKPCTGCSTPVHLCTTHAHTWDVPHDSNRLLCNTCGGPCLLCRRRYDQRMSKPCPPCITFVKQASEHATRAVFATCTPLYPDLVNLVLQYVEIAATMLY